jgi:hypothetical protein
MPSNGAEPGPPGQGARDEQFRLKVKALILAREELLRRNEELRAKNAALEKTIQELYEMLKPEDGASKPEAGGQGARDALRDFNDLYGAEPPPAGAGDPAAEQRADRLARQLGALLNLVATAMEKNKRQAVGDASQLIDMLGDIAKRS